MSPPTPVPQARSRAPKRKRIAAREADRQRATQELRALAHPLRLRLVEEFAGGARTTMQVAAAMGEPPTRLYHHVNALERVGILKLARTRQVRGTTEKYYEVAKKTFGPKLGTRITRGMKGSIRNLTYMLFEEARADLLAAIADPSKLTRDAAPVALRVLLTVSPAQLARVRKELLALVESIQKECKRQPPPADALRWALTVAFAPRGVPTQE
jgi:DNA-binding transcriptional ArsR family regulator